MKFSATLSFFCVVASAIASPALESRKETPDVTPVVTICIAEGSGCIPVPISGSDCIDLNGGLTILNDNVGLTTIPSGMICNFFPAFACSSFQSFFQIGEGVPTTIEGSPNFSSFTCSVL